MLVLLVIVLAAIALVAWFYGTSLLIDAAKSKGYKMDNTGILWFVSLFLPLGIIVLGLYVNALPYRVNSTTK